LIVGSGWWEAGVPGIELYDPDAGAFHRAGGTIPSGKFGEPRTTATLTLLTNGRAFAMLQEAEGGDSIGEALVYDLASGTFTATGDTTVYAYAATLLPAGTVLVTGYPDLLPGRSSSADLYDPATGSFFAAGEMATPRYGHTATLLPDGTVLITGGFPFMAVPVATAEIYHPPVLVPSPVLSSLSGDGKGPGAILRSETHEVVSPDNPAVAGETLEIYLTGLTDGSVVPPQVAIGGRMAQVLFFGKAPGFASLNQVNVRVPSGVVAGAAVGVRLTYLSRPSNEVTIAVQ
jgi:hypothetical protein